MQRFVVLGGGRMGSALIGGMLRSGWASPSDVAVVETRLETRTELEERFPGIEVAERPPESGSVILAVKPKDAEAACEALGPAAASPMRRRVLSVVAGLPIAKLEKWLGAGDAVIRSMSNMPALVGAGASVIAGGTYAEEEDLVWAEGVLSSIGVVARLDEQLLDAVTGLTGSGPAYIFLVAEALVDAGVLEGIDRDVARMLVVQTILGSARMLAETGESATVLREAVTSPGGTTAAGLRELERASVRASFMNAVSEAAARSRAIGGGA